MQKHTNSQMHTSSWALVLLAAITTVTVAAGVCPLSKENNSACCAAQVKSCDNEPTKCTSIECSSERGSRDCSGAATSTTRCNEDTASVTRTVKTFAIITNENGACIDCGTAELSSKATTPSCPDTHYTTDANCNPS